MKKITFAVLVFIGICVFGSPRLAAQETSSQSAATQSRATSTERAARTRSALSGARWRMAAIVAKYAE